MAVLFYFAFSLALSLRRQRSLWQSAVCDELFVLGILSFLPQLICKPVLASLLILTVIHDALLRLAGLALRPELLPHFLRPAVYLHSLLKAGISFWESSLLLLVSLSALAVLPNTPSWPGIVFLAFGMVPTSKDHVLLFFIKDLFAKKKRGAIQSVSFPGEEAKPICRKYPLLRETHKFLGEKRFSLRIDPQEKPHVIFCLLESFGSRHLGLAPNFQKLCNEGIFFSRFYANSILTNQSLISILFGIPSSQKPSLNLQDYVDLPLIGLPKFFKEAGYRTALIRGGKLEPAAFASAHGFETLLDRAGLLRENPEAPCTSWGVHDETMFRSSADWLAKQVDSVFLTLLTVTNHFPWSLPPEWKPPPEAKGHPFLGSYAYTDSMLGSWMARLRELGLLERSIIFFLGDHAQGLGEHNPQYIARNSLYEEDVQVPLLIYAPGRIEKGMIIDEPCSQIDLLPTVLDLFDSKTRHHSLGISLLRKKKRFLYFSSPSDGGLLGCRLGKWKAMIGQKNEELYDLAADPKESLNLASKYPRRFKRLKEMLENYSASLQELYHQKAFSMPEKASFYAPPKVIEDRGLARELKRRKDLYSLDLSNCLRVTERSVGASNLRILNLSGCLNINFPLLASKHPNLLSLNLSCCPLLTDDCLDKVFKRCTELEEIVLKGNVNLKSISSEPLKFLYQLNLLECFSLEASWLDWISEIPNLDSLRLSCYNWNDVDFQRLRAGGWFFLHLAGCRQIGIGSIARLLAQCTQLRILILEDCRIPDSELSEVCEKLVSNCTVAKIKNNMPYVIFRSFKKASIDFSRFAECPGRLTALRGYR